MSSRCQSGGLPAPLGPGIFLGALVKLLRRTYASGTRSGPIEQVQLALVIPVDEKFAQEVTRIQIEILRKYGRNPGLQAYPHITLKMGFSARDIAPFEKYVEKLASEVPSFEIAVRNFDSFEDGILFLNVEPNPALDRLRQRVLFDLMEGHGIKPEEIEGAQFRFHVTLAHGLANPEFDELRESFATREMQFKFNARHIDLFCHTGQQWVSYIHAAMRDARHHP